MADHRQRAIFRIAVVNVPLARFCRAVGVGEVLIEMIAEVVAPNQMAAEIAVSETDDVIRLVGEEGERDDETFVALAAGDGALEQALAEEIEDPIIAGACELHPRVDAEESVVR